MNIYIGSNSFWLDWGFPEKISRLKKNNSIKFNINIYVDAIVQNDEIDQINFLKSLNSIPETIYASKSNYYWWCFDGCILLDKKIYQDKSYYDYQGRDSKKWNIELTVSYKDVWGSNKKTVLERDMKLRELFNE